MPQDDIAIVGENNKAVHRLDGLSRIRLDYASLVMMNNGFISKLL